MLPYNMAALTRLPMSRPEEAPQQLVDLMWQCLAPIPEARPTARECVEVIAALQ